MFIRATKSSSDTLMMRLMPLLPHWVFVYEGPASLRRVRNTSPSSLAVEVTTPKRLSRIVQGWLVGQVETALEELA